MNGLLTKKTLELTFLPKVEEKHPVTSQHTDESGKRRLNNGSHVVTCPNPHNEESCQQHPNDTNNLLRNLTQGVWLHVIEALEKAS